MTERKFDVKTILLPAALTFLDLWLLFVGFFDERFLEEPDRVDGPEERKQCKPT